MMEADASGTRAVMQLETGSGEEGRFVSMRQRNQETARRFLYDEDEGVQTKTTVKNTTTAASLFGNREESDMEAVNLMDHETGIYTQQQDKSFTGRVKRFFFGGASPGEHDAIAADSEVYLGDRASRTSSIFVRLRHLLCGSLQRFLVCCIVIVSLFAIAFYSLEFFQTHHLSPEEELFKQNTVRFREIWEVITFEGISEPEALLNATSPQARAMRWIAYSDPAQLEPDNQIIIQRYALAVFFFNSYMFFVQKVNAQQIIEHENGDQFQGVPTVGWYAQDYWLTEKGICLWYGVECGLRQINGIQQNQYDDNDHIVAMNLTNNYVWGTIPNEIKGLSSLERLDLSRNRVSGRFPAEVRRLTKLRYLKLQDNRMTGPLPIQVGFMQSATDVVISNNEFTGSVPTEIRNLSNLITLDFSKNKLSKQFPSLSGLLRLRYLYLQNNEFTGTLPFSFVEIIDVREIHVENNRMGGTIHPEFQTLSKLRVFSAQDNEFKGKLPKYMFQSNTELEYFSVQFNQISGELPSFAGQLTALRTMLLHDNSITGSFPTEWTNMENLEILHMQNNEMHGKIPENIGTFKKLREFWVNNNLFTGPVPSSISECTSLELAYLQKNKFSQQIPAEIGNMATLRTLRLEENDVVGAVPESICNLNSLTFFSTDCQSKVTCPDGCCNQCY